MKLYSTNNKKHIVSLREAILHSLPPDNGLYMPIEIPSIHENWIQEIDQLSFTELSFIIAKKFFEDSIADQVLYNIVAEAIDFPAPVIRIADQKSILELFHGPTLAFKDFGARFMARIMNHYWGDNNQKLNILVATSGDTGGAVAAGFDGMENIEVTILYPKGKVSSLQKKQLTTWGENITAIEIEGNFDDCQKLVKEAFLDQEINQKLSLSSANSINIARLIPQSFYYFESYKQSKNIADQISYVVPSGNFGNLTAGLFAKKMGLPIHKMIAATNKNDVFTHYIQTGIYEPKMAVHTLSNAMDIGKPSNFARIMDMYGSTWNHVKKDIISYSFDDPNTLEKIKTIHKNNGYVLDPHSAVGVLAAEQHKKSIGKSEELIILSTAHPIKFAQEVAPHIDFSIPYPIRVQTLEGKKENWVEMSGSYTEFKDFLLSK